MSITVYSKSGCSECVFTKKLLESKEIAFEEKRVDLNSDYLDEVLSLGYRTLPVVQINNDETFTGYQPEKIEQLINQ